MYGAVDMLVVGQFATAADVSAVSTGSWLMQLITSFVVGIAMGYDSASWTEAGRRKAGRSRENHRSQYRSLYHHRSDNHLFMELCAVPVAQIMRTPIEAFDATVLYVRICSARIGFIVAYNVLGSIFRGIGDSRMPLVTVAIACVFNIAGDFPSGGRFRHGDGRSGDCHGSCPGAPA